MAARKPSCSASEWGGSDRSSSGKKLDNEPDPEPPSAPPIIILSENSSWCGTQPQRQDPVHALPHPCTSFPRSRSSTPENTYIDESHTFTSSKPKPEPEPHPAPPVIILSHTKRPAPASPPGSSPPPSPSPRLPNGFSDDTQPASTLDSANTHRAMGSKASKLAPQGDKMTAQERKDKEEMKEPTNYYTHRSKSMRRKAGKEGTTSGVGGAAGGSGGGGAGGMA